jgi:hypothetical protein
MTAKKAPVQQPRFDPRIYSLVYPLLGNRNPSSGTLKRGFMIWEKPLTGFSGLATVHFLYNPSVVQASFPISDSTAQAILQFPNPGDKADLRVPLYQTVSWSLLFDRTYELWGSVDEDRTVGRNNNNPRAVGVMADMYQMQQFTGMTVGYSNNGLQNAPSNQTFAGHQGIVQIVPCYVYFGKKEGLSFYGYISEWDVQVTHWNQQMTPMRCVVDITFTMLPPPQNTSKPGSNADTSYVAQNITRDHIPGTTSITPSNAGISGR